MSILHTKALMLSLCSSAPVPTSLQQAPPLIQRPSTTLSTNLLRRPLSTHLALNSPRLSPCTCSRTLRLLLLLLALTVRLLLLALCNGLLASSFTRFGTLGAAVFDQFEWGANDASLLLYCSSGAFFGNFLCAGECVSAGRYYAGFGRCAVLILAWEIGQPTSEIPFLCCLRYNVVHAIRRGFLR